MNLTGSCAQCTVNDRICQHEAGSGPAGCSTLLYPEALSRAADEYAKPEIREFARQGALQEAECYIGRDSGDYWHPSKPRLQEIIEFARRMGYSRLGVAFCGGLHQEGAIFCQILADHGFEVVSVVCKVGGVDKSTLGVRGEEKIRVGKFEAMCNPIAQAEILNEAQTQFNIMVGLCVGHDSLFIKYSVSPVTVFAVKDRVLGHNPLAAVYNYNSYYRRFKRDQLKDLIVKG